MKLALLQMDLSMEIEDNHKKALEMIEEVMLRQPDTDMIVLPELWNYPFYFKKPFQKQLDCYSQTLDGASIHLLSQEAIKHQVMIVAGSIALHNKEQGSNTNTMVIIESDGKVISTYDKVHLCSWNKEDILFQHGVTYKPVSTRLGRLAPLICYDIRFPELARSYAMQGADCFVVVADFGESKEFRKKSQWKTLLQARAIENQMFVIACDRCGEGPDALYFGDSIVIDPAGKILAEASDKEEILICEIELESVIKERERIPVYRDKRLI